MSDEKLKLYVGLGFGMGRNPIFSVTINDDCYSTGRSWSGDASEYWRGVGEVVSEIIVNKNIKEYEIVNDGNLPLTNSKVGAFKVPSSDLEILSQSLRDNL